MNPIVTHTRRVSYLPTGRARHHICVTVTTTSGTITRTYTSSVPLSARSVLAHHVPLMIAELDASPAVQPVEPGAQIPLL